MEVHTLYDFQRITESGLDRTRGICRNGRVPRIFQLPQYQLRKFILELDNCLKGLSKCIIWYYPHKGSFSRDSANSSFSFWLHNPERRRRIRKNSKSFTQFQKKIWHYTDSRNLESIPLRYFLPQQHSFQDSRISNLPWLRNSFLPQVFKS